MRLCSDRKELNLAGLFFGWHIAAICHDDCSRTQIDVEAPLMYLLSGLVVDDIHLEIDERPEEYDTLVAAEEVVTILRI